MAKINPDELKPTPAPKWIDSCPFCYSKEQIVDKLTNNFHCSVCKAQFWAPLHDNLALRSRFRGSFKPHDPRDFPRK